MSAKLFANEDTIDALIVQMSIQQKIGQLVQTERMAVSAEEVAQYHIGSVLSGGGSWPGDNRVEDWVAMNEAYWQATMKPSAARVNIPIIYGVDAVHGHNNVQGATIFPHNIGLGAANDPDLMHRIAQATAREILATGVDWTFAPTIAVAKDAHWGRMYESYGETPEIASGLVGPVVQGLQGALDDDSVAACLKHWVGDGGTRAGVDQGDTSVTWDELNEAHITPYLAGLQAGALSVMVSFSSWNRRKCHGHRFLITDYLKGTLGFGGVVISDWDGIDYLSKDYPEAIAQGLNAGIDVFMVSENWREFLRAMEDLIAAGVVSMTRLDDAVRRMLRLKFALGLFHKPSPALRKWSNSSCFGSDAHRQVAREAVRKSLVLLKNSNSILPLNRSARILVAGKSAHNIANQCGGFTIGWQGVPSQDGLIGSTTIWEAIKACAPNAQFSHAGLGQEANQDLHDVALVVIGETPYAEGFGDIRANDNAVIETGSQVQGLMKVLQPYGQSLHLAQLHPEDLACIKTIVAQGVPVVAVMLSGRPLVVTPELALADGFVAAWLPGSEGAGVADVLFGDADFSACLSFSWMSDEAGTGQARVEAANLFPAGYGLTYAGEVTD